MSTILTCAYKFKPLPVKKLDTTPCEYKDDAPFVPLEERILRAKAMGEEYAQMMSQRFMMSMDAVDPLDGVPDDRLDTLQTDMDVAVDPGDATMAYRKYMAEKAQRLYQFKMAQKLAEIQVKKEQVQVNTEPKSENKE